MSTQAKPEQTNNLFLLEDLDDAGKTRDLAATDLEALRSVASWMKTFIAQPNKDLGRGGSVCPYVPTALDQKTLWLAPERVTNRSASDVAELMNGYKKLFLDTQAKGDAAAYNVIVVVFTDLPADRAGDLFAEVLNQLSVPSYAEDQLLLGPFYKGNDGTAIYNSNFRPFQSPVPFLFVRHGVVADWKFFLDKDDWLKLWAGHNRESGVEALAGELRTLPWRVSRPLQ